MIDSSLICVYALEPYLEDAEEFAARLGVKLIVGPAIVKLKKHSPSLSDYTYVIYFGAKSVSILQTGKSAPGPVSASFVSGKTLHRLKFGGGKGQMISKAVGLHKRAKLEVLDATAGLGQDAFVLASLGCRVKMIERSPIVAKLLSSALHEAQSFEDGEDSALLREVGQRMSLVEANAVEWLTQTEKCLADVIYLDPMYPERDKSSKVKKEMSLFHLLVGSDADDAALLDEALRKARYRVVVKRPRLGQSIDGPEPTLQIVGKSCRYDIYTLKSL